MLLLLCYLILSSCQGFYWVMFIVSAIPHSLETHHFPQQEKTVPRMADNCTLFRKSGTSSLRNQVFTPFVMLPRGPIKKAIIMTFEAPWNLLISNASSWSFWNLPLFSSGDALVRWHSYVNKCWCLVSLCAGVTFCKYVFSHQESESS